MKAILRSRAPLAAIALMFGVQACAEAEPNQLVLSGDVSTAEIEAVVRDYILENPEVISDALQILAERERQEIMDQLVNDPGSPELGPADAPITIVEFFDYNCGFCKKATDWVLAQLDADSADVRVVFKELPILDNRTGTSANAARAALAAAKQGKYREMHVALMDARDLSDPALEGIAREIGLNVKKWRGDMASADINAQLERDSRAADMLGVQGTPGFFINGSFVGGYDPRSLQALVDAARSEG